MKDMQDRGYEVTSAGQVVVDEVSLLRSEAVQHLFELAGEIVSYGTGEKDKTAKPDDRQFRLNLR